MSIIFSFFTLTLITISKSHGSFYDYLGVDRDFTPETLKNAYDNKIVEARLITENAVDPERLTKAYETLSDRINRKVYDIYGEAGLDNKCLAKKQSMEGERHRTWAKFKN